MVRIFSFLAALVATMILVAGFGVYWASGFEVNESRHDSARLSAKASVLGIETQIDLLNKMLDKMAQDPDVLLAVTRADPAVLTETAAALEQHLPNVLKIRLLLPTVNNVNDTGVPPMGFADLEMVRETFVKTALPAIQGNNGTDRHLAISRRIYYNNQVIGVILASLNYDFITANLQAVATKDSYIELKQGTLVLGMAGEKSNMQHGDVLQLKVAGTDWRLSYHYAYGSSAGHLIITLSFIVIPMLLAMLAFFVAQRTLSGILTQDLRTVMKAFKDLIGHKSQGSYPVQLAEMNAIVSTLVQFKRVMDSDKDTLAKADVGFFNSTSNISDSDDFQLDDFFDEPMDFKL